MKVITLSKCFPPYHPRTGEPTNFGPLFLDGSKIHTIRKNEKGYFQSGDVVSVRQWSGRPYWSEQETLRDGVQIGVVPVTIEFVGGNINIKIGDKFPFLWDVALNDGLTELSFYHWFNPRAKLNLTLNYSLIHFTDFRYM